MKADASFKKRSASFRLQRFRRLAKQWFAKLRAVSSSARIPSNEAQALAMIEASGLLQRNWYLNRYPDVAEAGMDPASHYLIHGGFENRDPGPGFRTQWYLSQYPDAAASGLNPLIHYLVFGKAARRSPLPPHEPVMSPELAQDIEILLSSRLLDTDWYRAHTPALPKGRESVARHYLERGAKEGKNPSPAFDTRAYWNAYPDVEAAGANPLLHYLRHGRGEGRKIFAAQADSGCDLWGDESGEEDDAVAGPWVGAHAFQTSPPQDWFSVGEIPLGKATRAERDRWRSSVSDFIGESSVGRRSVRPAGQNAPPWVADVWFISDHTLRLRLNLSGCYAGVVRPLVARAYQTDLSGGEIRLLDEQPTKGGILSLVDFTLLNPYAPLLLTLTDAEGTLLEIQTLSFPSLARHGAHHAELVVLSRSPTPQDDLWEVSDALWSEFVDESEGELSIGRLNVDLLDAVGGERLFTTSCLEWLARVMRVGLVPTSSSESFLTETLATMPVIPGARDGGDVILTTPADGVPSISALVSRRLDVSGPAAVAGGYAVADAARARPRWSVFPPATEPKLDALQPRHGPLAWPLLTRERESSNNMASRSAPAFPLVVRFLDERFEPTPAEQLTPTARDIGEPLLRTALTKDQRDGFRISAVVQVSSTDIGVETALAALASQSVEVEEVILLGADERCESAVALAENYFSNRIKILSGMSRAALINKGVAESAGDYLLFLDAGVVLHDPRTLETLAVLARTDGVASAGCVAVEEHEGRNDWNVRIHGGGLLPSHISFTSSPRLILKEARSVSALPPMTYAVAANPFRLALMSRATWDDLGGLDAARFPDRGYDLDFGWRALEAGGTHLCTSVVSVAVLEGALVHDHVDVIAPRGLDVLVASGWLSRLTAIRELS